MSRAAACVSWPGSMDHDPDPLRLHVEAAAACSATPGMSDTSAGSINASAAMGQWHQCIIDPMHYAKF